MIKCFICLGRVAKVPKKESTLFMAVDFQNWIRGLWLQDPSLKLRTGEGLICLAVSPKTGVGTALLCFQEREILWSCKWKARAAGFLHGMEKTSQWEEGASLVHTLQPWPLDKSLCAAQEHVPRPRVYSALWLDVTFFSAVFLFVCPRASAGAEGKGDRIPSRLLA